MIDKPHRALLCSVVPSFCGAMELYYSNVFSRTVISGKGQRVFAGAEMHSSIVNIPAVVAEHR